MYSSHETLSSATLTWNTPKIFARQVELFFALADAQ